MNRKIVTIGGGELHKLETLSIDREIVELTGKSNPKALFIPTASQDSTLYAKSFNKVYGEKLGCKVDTLYLVNTENNSSKMYGNDLCTDSLNCDSISKEEIERKILWADLIYVGGGNTKFMLEVWRKYDVDKLLIEAYNNGTVLSGLSAGSICWYKYGHSDSPRFHDDVKDSNFIRLKALSLIDGFHCPHFNEDGRADDFKNMISFYGGIGIAIDNNCAIEFINDKFRVIKSNSNSNAYKVYKKDSTVVCENLELSKQFKPISELF